MRIRDIMSTPSVAVTPGTTLAQAATVMAENGFTTLPVVEPTGRLLGTITEAEVMTAEDPGDFRARGNPDTGVMIRPRARTVAEAMTPCPDRTVTEDSDVSEVARQMIETRVRAVAVAGQDRVVGMVSLRDILRAHFPPLSARP